MNKLVFAFFIAAAPALAAVPSDLDGVYEETAGRGLRRLAEDPAALALKASRVRLWVERHGEAEVQRERVFSGQRHNLRSPLTRTAINPSGFSGVQQARTGAAKLYSALGGDDWARAVIEGAKEPLVILHSPALRAKETADFLAQLLDQKGDELGSAAPLFEMHDVPALIERDFGRLEGRPWKDAATLPWKYDDRNFLDRFPDGESMLDIVLRERELFFRIAQQWAGRDVVAISHRGTVNAQSAVAGRLPLHPDGAMKLPDPPNAEPVLLFDAVSHK